FRVRAALLVLLALPPAIDVAVVLRGHDRDLALRILLRLEAAQLGQRPVPRVPVGRGDVVSCGGRTFDDDDLVGERVQGAQRVAGERLAVQHDHAEGDPRVATSGPARLRLIRARSARAVVGGTCLVLPHEREVPAVDRYQVVTGL